MTGSSQTFHQWLLPRECKSKPSSPQHPPSSVQNDAESSRMLTHALKDKHMTSQAKLLWMCECCLHLSEGDASGWEAVFCPTGVGVWMWITTQFPPASEWKASRISRPGSSPALNLLRCRCMWRSPPALGARLLLLFEKRSVMPDSNHQI